MRKIRLAAAETLGEAEEILGQGGEEETQTAGKTPKIWVWFDQPGSGERIKMIQNMKFCRLGENMITSPTKKK